MSFPFDLENGDEQFVDQIRASKERDMTIARLVISRVWCFWAMWLALICSTAGFTISCIDTKFQIQTFLSSFIEAYILPLPMLLSYISLDTQIKSLKLARHYDQDETS